MAFCGKAKRKTAHLGVGFPFGVFWSCLSILGRVAELPDHFRDCYFWAQVAPWHHSLPTGSQKNVICLLVSLQSTPKQVTLENMHLIRDLEETGPQTTGGFARPTRSSQLKKRMFGTGTLLGARGGDTEGSAWINLRVFGLVCWKGWNHFFWLQET